MGLTETAGLPKYHLIFCPGCSVSGISDQDNTGNFAKGGIIHV
jgi:hypothetical protein